MNWRSQCCTYMQNSLRCFWAQESCNKMRYKNMNTWFSLNARAISDSKTNVTPHWHPLSNLQSHCIASADACMRMQNSLLLRQCTRNFSCTISTKIANMRGAILNFERAMNLGSLATKLEDGYVLHGVTIESPSHYLHQTSLWERLWIFCHEVLAQKLKIQNGFYDF